VVTPDLSVVLGVDHGLVQLYHSLNSRKQSGSGYFTPMEGHFAATVKARPLLTHFRQCSVTHRRCVVVIANLVLTHPAYGSYVDIS